MNRTKDKGQDLRLNPLFTIGRPFAPFYSAAMAMRAALYQRGVFNRHRLAVPVVSVGNLTLGGTGKTPMVIYLARLLAANRVAIVSRGYGGKAKGKVNVVSDGRRVLLDARQAGDEPHLMATLLPDVPVLTAKKRVLAGYYGVEKLGAGLVLLDDGFQHLALARDLDIVLFKVDSFLGNNRVFPGGEMREPLSALGRAHCFVLTCVDEENRKKAEALRRALVGRFPEIPVFFSSYQPACLVDTQGMEHDFSCLAQQRISAFCGLAQPAYFKKSLAQAGLTACQVTIYPDHHRYRPRHLEALVAADQEKYGVTALVTTEKDMVKLGDFTTALPVFALRMEVIVEEGFDDFVCRQLAVAKRPQP